MKIKKKKRKAKLFGPIVTILILTFLIMIVSSVLSLVGFEADKTVISNGQLETNLVTVNNIFSLDGLKYLASGIITNFMLFEPLVLLIISLIAVGIGEASGLFKAAFQPFKKINPTILTFLVFFLGVISSVIGEYSYIILLPFIGVFYKTIGKNPILGILTIFLGITLGYGTGIIFSYDDYLLGTLTQEAARLDVDNDYVYGLFSNLYIMIASSLMISVAGTIAIQKFIAPKLKKPEVTEDELVVSKKALLISRIALIIMCLFILYMIIPGISGSGLFLGEGERYIERLFGEEAPFSNGVIYLFLIVMMVCGFLYGYISKNIKDSNDYSLGLSKNFENLGYVFVLMFFTAQMISILNWTNLNEVIGAKIIEWISVIELSGMLLIVVMFIGIVLISLLMPDTLSKWILASPILVPLFMRANINPDFTQFIFRAADGVGKSFTPFFVYFLIMLAFLEKYNYNQEHRITVRGTMKLVMPVVITIACLWLVIILCWYLVGLPIGIGSSATL